MELDPLYADGIVQRFEQVSGKKAERIAADSEQHLEEVAARSTWPARFLIPVPSCSGNDSKRRVGRRHG